MGSSSAMQVQHMLTVPQPANEVHTVVSGSAGGELIVWHLNSSWEEPMVMGHRVQAHAASVSALVWCAPRLLASAAVDGTLCIWSDPSSCDGPFVCLHSLPCTDGAAEAVALLWHTPSNMLVSHCGQTVQLWDPSLKEPFPTPLPLPAYFTVSPGGCSSCAEGLTALSQSGMAVFWLPEQLQDGATKWVVAAEVQIWPEGKSIEALDLGCQTLICCSGDTVVCAAPARDVYSINLNAATAEHIAVVKAQSLAWITSTVTDAWSNLCKFVSG